MSIIAGGADGYLSLYFEYTVNEKDTKKIGLYYNSHFDFLANEGNDGSFINGLMTIKINDKVVFGKKI